MIYLDDGLHHRAFVVDCIVMNLKLNSPYALQKIISSCARIIDHRLDRFFGIPARSVNGDLNESSSVVTYHSIAIVYRT